MTGLLADGWFYISSAGLLVSGALFFFLLGQYRAATDAADQAEPAAEAHGPLVRPLSIPDEPASSPKVASVTVDKPAEPAPAPAPAPAEKRRETATGAVNPAVVYLQNIKSELQELHDETRELAKRVDSITGRDEALIERLTELAQAVAELKASVAPASAPVESPAPKRAKKIEPSPAVVIEIPAVEPAAERPALSIEPTTVAGVQDARPEPQPEPKPEPAPEAAVAPAAAPEGSEPVEKPRRGPVWPV